MTTAVIIPPEQKNRKRTIEELLQSVSASRLSTWQQCRLKFWFRYISPIHKPKTPALIVGSSVHETLKFWNMARWRNESPTLKQLHDVFSTAWGGEQQSGESVNWDGEEQDQKATGWRLLETYFRESPIKADEKPEGVEVSVEAHLGCHGLPTLVGIIDLVRPPGRIVDFKTSGKCPDPEKAAHLHDTQTTGYAVLYREATGKKESGIELHHLVKTKQPKLVVTAFDAASDIQITRLFRVIESYVHSLERQDWIPAPGMQCAACEFFNECRLHC